MSKARSTGCGARSRWKPATRWRTTTSATHCARAARRAPRFANAHYNLALALRELGESAPALAAARAAIGCDPAHRAAWQLFAELLAPLRFTAWDAALAADCERLFGETDVEVQDCAEAVWSLVRTAPRGRLFLLLLENALVADEEFEREMAALRRELLAAPKLELCCALAQQCFMNEHIWPEREDETARLSGVRPASALEFAAFAMYRPISGLEKPAGAPEAFERMWRRLAAEPAEEAALEVPVLTPVKDDVSRKVQAQYEANPYPRWHGAPAAGAFPLPRMLRSLFPHLDAAKLAATHAPEILIAGCGTGRHAAISAQLHPHGRILALDVSRASLAFAMRRCAELGLANLRFAQADILELGALGSRFDLIECSGVLHHMSDPLAGWRVLASLLKPGGFMKLGLYSEAGRRAVTAARALVQGLGITEARERILALAAGHPARAVARLPDFYYASGVRDLLLHVQERRFTVADIARAVDALGLELLGFELRGRRAPMTAAQWEAHEAAHPETFASMYQFWVRKPEGR